MRVAGLYHEHLTATLAKNRRNIDLFVRHSHHYITVHEEGLPVGQCSLQCDLPIEVQLLRSLRYKLVHHIEVLGGAFFELVDLELAAPLELAAEVVEHAPIVKSLFLGRLLLQEVKYGLHGPGLPVSELATDDRVFTVGGLWVRRWHPLFLLFLALLLLVLFVLCCRGELGVDVRFRLRWNKPVIGFHLVEFVVDVELFLVVYLQALFAQLLHGWAPKDVAFDFFVAEPAMILPLGHDLPLAHARDVILVVEVAHEY